jgi:hypothetical protein
MGLQRVKYKCELLRALTEPSNANEMMLLESVTELCNRLNHPQTGQLRIKVVRIHLPHTAPSPLRISNIFLNVM